MATRTDTLIWLGIAGAIAYIVYKAPSLPETAKNALKKAYDEARESMADTFYEWWGPPENFGPGMYLMVTLVEPGAPRHAIGADQISQGQFRYGGKTYRIADNAQGQHFGVPVTD